jgi:hypothetical protein
MPGNPIYQHDCDACRFLGSGPCRALDQRRAKVKHIYDFYVCEDAPQRSFLARYGNRPEEYMSNRLFCCAELTVLDKIALYNGLELTPTEEKHLLRTFASMWRQGFNMNDAEQLVTSSDCTFGTGNVVFENI